MSVRSPSPAARLTRRRDGRWVAGVCNGLAAALGVPVGALRAVVVVLAPGNLPAVALLYALAWAFLPPETGSATAGGAGAGGGTAGDTGRRPGAGAGVAAGGPTVAGRAADPLDAIGVLAVVVGAVLLLGQFTAWLPGQVVAPAVVAIVGAGLAWGWGGRPATTPPAGGGAAAAGPAGGAAAVDGTPAGPREPLRPLVVAVGISLVIVGGVATLAAVGDLRSIGRSSAGAAVVTAGAVLLFGPWMVRLARNLADERRQRIRSEERAEVAAHLHDGVLQTLALIQKRAGDDKAVRSLARRQERELRTWLYGTRGAAAASPETNGDGAAATVATLLRRELDDVEDRYGVRLDAVLVGDAPLDDAGRALVAAGREAALNAARHAGVDTVDVYLEVEPERVSLFVRDRGRGFDPAAVPPDRRGVADSISARVRRHGGTAEVRSAPGEGAEVELSVPRTAARVEEKPR